MVLLVKIKFVTMEIRLDVQKIVSVILATLVLPESVINHNVSQSVVMEFELQMKFVTVVNY